MDRKHYDADHLDFGRSFRAFAEREIVPRFSDFQRAGITDRDVFASAGRAGFLGFAVPTEYGGLGVTDFRFNQVLAEQAAQAGIGGVGLGLTLHNDICMPYFLEYASEEQRRRWLPGITDGSIVTAIAMTEPGAGSDLGGVQTNAKRDGPDYIINGAKTFITNGINADLIITAVRTERQTSNRRDGLSLLVLERGMAGFDRGRNLEKIGLHAQDTAELSFQSVRVPACNLLGEEGAGFTYLSAMLPQERTSIAVAAVAEARSALSETLEYVRGRRAFGTTVGSFQHTKLVLADLATQIDVAQAFVDQCVDRLSERELSASDASMAKYFCTELQGRVVDACLQLHGGYGYMSEYPIARRYVDARVTRIYGGTSEIMRSVISKSLGL